MELVLFVFLHIAVSEGEVAHLEPFLKSARPPFSMALLDQAWGFQNHPKFSA